MKVTLIRLDGWRSAMTAAYCCVSTGMARDPTPRSLLKAVRSGHLSILEHVTATFTIEGISRACSHQLVRHRLASYAQQSQRYVDMKGFGYTTPKSIAECGSELYAGDDGDGNPIEVSMEEVYDDFMKEASHVYETLVANGIPEEDARYVLPNACTTNLVVTMNLRELSHFLGLRRCARAQDEIRALADEMARQVRHRLAFTESMDRATRTAEDWALWSSLLEPQCVRLGYCPEEDGCGRFGRKEA